MIRPLHRSYSSGFWTEADGYTIREYHRARIVARHSAQCWATADRLGAYRTEPDGRLFYVDADGGACRPRFKAEGQQ